MDSSQREETDYPGDDATILSTPPSHIIRERTVPNAPIALHRETSTGRTRSIPMRRLDDGEGDSRVDRRQSETRTPLMRRPSFVEPEDKPGVDVSWDDNELESDVCVDEPSEEDESDGGSRVDEPDEESELGGESGRLSSADGGMTMGKSNGDVPGDEGKSEEKPDGGKPTEEVELEGGSKRVKMTTPHHSNCCEHVRPINDIQTHLVDVYATSLEKIEADVEFFQSHELLFSLQRGGNHSPSHRPHAWDMVMKVFQGLNDVYTKGLNELVDNSVEVFIDDINKAAGDLGVCSRFSDVFVKPLVENYKRATDKYRVNSSGCKMIF